MLVYRDVLDRWASSRVIWNQHAYAVTNITEDGTVPRTSQWQPNWRLKGLNNFRQNVQGGIDPTSTPDLTAGKPGSAGSVEPNPTMSCDKDGTMTLRANLCNRGTLPVGAGLPLSFYKGDPAQKQLICTARSKAQIDPGTCETVSCPWKNAPENNPTDVWMVADDAGLGKGTTTECEEGNNRGLLKGLTCSGIY